MKTTKLIQSVTNLLILLSCLFAEANADMIAAVQDLQYRWAQVNYQLQGKEQINAFDELVKRVNSATHAYPESAEVWIWSGIIKSSFAGAKGGLGALGLAKDARKDLEKAMTFNSEALDGSAYTSLGTLFFKVPGWPLGFGDDEKAEELLKQALRINPDGIDPNYFYGEFLREGGRYEQAQVYLLKAQHASSRPNRFIADTGRQKEIKAALALVENKLGKHK